MAWLVNCFIYDWKSYVTFLFYFLNYLYENFDKPKLFHLLTISGDWRHHQFSLILMVGQTSSCWNNFPLDITILAQNSKENRELNK